MDLVSRPPGNPANHWVWGSLGLAGGMLVLAWSRAAVARLRRPGYPDRPPRKTGVPFATGDPRPVWPIAANSRHPRKYEVPYRDVDGRWYGNQARAFKARRNGRTHVGIDLYSNAGDVVLAPEDGTVVRIQPFYSGTNAMLIQGDHGITVLLGEIDPHSPAEFGVRKGSRVVKGEPVARVGLANSQSHMLHFETYACCPDRNSSWYQGKPAPPLVRDPTEYLLRARAASV